ncbi:MAG: J domain-containing protein [Pseudomonadota bacterium]|nr:J domain-containing protein [Pseudomonadota bacterium]
MNCWEILGIEPTRDRERIREAFERQMKFASPEEARNLERAFTEATGGEQPDRPNAGSDTVGSSAVPSASEQPANVKSADDDSAPLSAQDSQVVREVVIQIKALMNDTYRQQDAGIWKAILCEPPADQLPLRREVGRQLEPQIRPMAENGTFPAPVARFLGDWFDWFSVKDAPALDDDAEPAYEQRQPRDESFADEADNTPQMINFWPAVIGWTVGLIILAMIFGGMGGG